MSYFHYFALSLTLKKEVLPVYEAIKMSQLKRIDFHYRPETQGHHESLDISKVFWQCSYGCWC